MLEKEMERCTRSIDTKSKEIEGILASQPGKTSLRDSLANALNYINTIGPGIAQSNYEVRIAEPANNTEKQERLQKFRQEIKKYQEVDSYLTKLLAPYNRETARRLS